MTLIGLTGHKRGGKDTAYQLIDKWCAHTNATQPDLAESRPHSSLRLAFADSLKVTAMYALGYGTDEHGQPRSRETLVWMADRFKVSGTVTADITFDEEEPFHSMTSQVNGREFLKLLATEGIRDNVAQSVWLDAILPIPAAKLFAEHQNLHIVLTDTNFLNEAQRILDAGGEIWLLSGRGLPLTSHRSDNLRDLTHLVTRVIDNSGTLDELESQVFALMDDLAE